MESYVESFKDLFLEEIELLLKSKRNVGLDNSVNTIEETKREENEKEGTLCRINEESFTFLLSDEGFQFLCKSKIIEKKKRKVELIVKHIVANECYLLNKKNQLYFVIIRMDHINNNNMYNIYNWYDTCKNQYNSNLKFYIHTTLKTGVYFIYEMKLINLNGVIWSTCFQEEVLKQKLKNIQINHTIYFILSFNLISPHFQKIIYKTLRKIQKDHGTSLLFIIRKEKENEKDIDRKEKMEIKYEEPNEIHDNSFEQKITSVRYMEGSFYNELLGILNLQANENASLLEIYKLEDYTRIFISNCDELNRDDFKQFLRSLESFVVFFYNLNTQFGTYFSETEKNILKIFKKCRNMSKVSDKKVLLVLDGIDIIATETKSKNKNKKKEESFINNTNNSKNEDEWDQTNRTITTTLLLCLDSIQNNTKINKRTKKKSSTAYTKKNQLGEPKDILHNLDDTASDSSSSSFGKNLGKLLKEEKELGRKILGSSDITYNQKKLKNLYKMKHIELQKMKTEENISIIVLSNLEVYSFESSFIRAGRFFHHLRYE